MTKPAKTIGPVNNAERGLSVGDYVHCHHAQAEGVVSKVCEFNVIVIVKVTATYRSNYIVGCEYAWLPMHLVPIAAPVLN